MGDPTPNPLPLRRGGAMLHADFPHLPCLLAKMWCISGIIINFNAFYYKKFKYGAINYRIWVICG